MNNNENPRRLSIVASNINPQQPEPLIDAKQASKYLSCYKPITILRMAHDGLLPNYPFPIRKTGKFRRMFKLSELEAYVLSLSRPARAA